MPYITSYPTNQPGLAEARLFAIQQMIVASLDDLNAALARDLLTPFDRDWEAKHVLIGDPQQISTSVICVTGGNPASPEDMTFEPFFIPMDDKKGLKGTIYTNIWVHIHPDDLPSDDNVKFTQFQEIARARICDHLRKRVFNCRQSIEIPLASLEYSDGSASNPSDRLNRCYCTLVWDGFTEKGVGETTRCYSARLLHRGEIA